MVQAAFAFPVPTGLPRAPRPLRRAMAAPRPADVDTVAVALGRDHARHGLVPPAAFLYPGNPVHEAWRQARARGLGPRAGVALPRPDVQAWMALRLQAWKEGADFDTLSLTPAFLGRARPTHCPVTRAPLPVGTGRWSRLGAETAYAAGHLALLDIRAAEALPTLRADDLPAWAGTPAPHPAPARTGGLDAPARARLATLQALVTPMPHGQAARLPLCALPPPRLRVVNPVQALQLLLSLQLLHAGYSQRIEALAALMPDDMARRAFKAFMVTLLARRLAAGRPQPDPLASRRALEDAWTHAAVLRAWVGLSLRLDAARCSEIVRRAEAAGLCHPHARVLPDEVPTQRA